jgi:hypothetical protein
MKYFKHMSIMSDDTKIKRIKRKYGLKGYGLYVLLLEYISKQLDKHSPLPDLQEKAEDIADEWGCDIREVNEMMYMMVNEGLFEIHYITGQLVCTKLEKYLDEYIRKIPEIGEAIEEFRREQERQMTTTQEDNDVSDKVRETPESVQRDSDKLPLEQTRREETRQDVSDGTSLPTSLSTKKDITRWKEHVKQRGTTDYPPAFESFWQAYPRSTDKKGAARAYLQTLESGATVEQLQRAAEGYAQECEGKEEKYVKHGKTFLGPEEPWRDYADYEPPKDNIKIAKKKIMVDRQEGE